MNAESEFPIPSGFLCSGLIAGIKEDTTRKDLGLIYTEKDAVLGAVYTRNKFPSAHVQYCKALTPSNSFRALVINSGNANAGTGEAGKKANLKLASALADQLGVSQSQVFTSSTGIIGEAFPIKIIESSLQSLVDGLGSSCLDVAEAIMTTDTRPKLASTTVKSGDKTYTITGFAKGSGMIHPDMATMLSYILTDAPLTMNGIQSLTKKVANQSFNRISVDGDTSTNDSFYLISSNPMAGKEVIAPEIEKGLISVAISLAKQVAADGEGARHLIEVCVNGADSEESGEKVLKSVLTSSLVKTAINGHDPNWGRILMAMGNGLVDSGFEDNEPVSISIQSTPIFDRGEPVRFDRSALSTAMSDFDIRIVVDLHRGGFSVCGWGCDFSTEYVHINAEYST